jgi:Skp family chaperone for outer membrane proteins
MLNRTFRAGLGALALGFGVVVALPSFAQDLSPPVVLVIDINQIMRTAKAAKSVQSQLEKTQAAYQQQITKQEEDLRAQDQELARQRTILAADAFADRRKQFEQKVGDVQKDVQSKRKALDQSYNDAMGKVQAAMVEIVSQIATEKRANLVLPKSEVVLVDKNIDFTEETLKRLDVKLPDVKVNPPSTTAAPATAAQQPAQRAQPPKKP